MRGDILKPTTGNEILHRNSIEDGIKVVNLTSKFNYQE
jgi:hypothetical protein